MKKSKINLHNAMILRYKQLIKEGTHLEKEIKKNKINIKEKK